MPEYLVDHVLSLPAQTADQLLKIGDGDMVLLYLALLRHGEAEPARKALHWSVEREIAAWNALSAAGLVSAQEPEPGPPVLEPSGPPEYPRSELMRALEEEGSFNALFQLIQQRLGKTLSDLDLKNLYEIYDYLALPVEVILLLTTWCIQDYQEKYGEGQVPRLSQIKKTAYVWKRLGLDSLEAADSYIRQQSGVKQRIRDLLPLLDITGRRPIPQEEKYLDSWIEMGFPDETIRLAYEKTILKKQSLSWPYMNSILKSWHSKGLHTLAEVSSKDHSSYNKKENMAVNSSALQKQAEQRLQEDMEWLMQFSKNSQ